MKYRLLLTLSFLALSFTGCTKEDMSICVSRTTFQCSFDFNNDNTDQFSKLVNKVDLYIFDESGLLARHISQSQDYLPDNYSVATDLAYGKYTAVLFGTQSNKDGVVVGTKQSSLNDRLLPMQEGVSRIEDTRSMLNSITGHSDKDLGVVLHGMVYTFTVTATPQTHNVSFIRNTSIVELNVKGLEALIPTPTRAESDIVISIEGDNKAYLYDNSLDLAKAIYTPYRQTYNSDILTAQLSILRLFQEHPMSLKVYSKNAVIWQLDLVKEIMKSPKYNNNHDLDREDKFVVDVVVTTVGDFTIVVNGWTTTTAGEIIG